MYRYAKVKIISSIDGKKDAKKDIKNNKIKKYIPINEMDILSKVYDKGYVDAYNKFVNKYKIEEDIILYCLRIENQ